MSDVDYSKIKTRQEFCDFASALRLSLRDDSENWENVNLDDFLKALEAWVSDMGDHERSQGKQEAVSLTWRDIARMFHSAAIYE
ncbi:hypothetical protein PWG15_12865 [Ensifer adhaerens]|uniref:DUF7660 family protein n=1 Tax=Ensifer adhaerens TaxID=106592 RepID=UPI0023A95C0E|nr:hypothetical protein [Ensifer adhaerens]WDZ75506.1 hypothetical protein PWG15_12865 [Ensifer adhaerens]